MPLWEPAQRLPDVRGPINAVAFSHNNGRYVVAGGNDRSIRLYNHESGALVQEYTSHGYEVLGIDVSGDNQRLASCGGDRTVFFWDVAQAQPIQRYNGHSARVNAVAFNAEASILVSGSWDTTVRIWDVKSRQRMPIQILDDATDSVTCLLVSNTSIFTGSVDGHVRQYDIRKGQLVDHFFEASVGSMMLTREGESIIVSTLDSTIRKMDLSNGKLLQKFIGHVNNDYRITNCMTNGEKWIVAGDEKGELVTWDHNWLDSQPRERRAALISEPVPVHQRQKISDRSVLCVASHPDPKVALVATGTRNGELQTWSWKKD